MVATLIMFTAGRGIAQLITDGQITYVRVDSYRTLGASLPGFPVPTPFIVAVVVVALTSLLLKKRIQSVPFGHSGIRPYNHYTLFLINYT